MSEAARNCEIIGRLLGLRDINTESDNHFPYFYLKAINTFKHTFPFC